MHECKSYLQCFDYEASSVSLILDPGFPIDFAHMYSACLAFAEVTLVSYRTVQTAYFQALQPIRARDVRLHKDMHGFGLGCSLTARSKCARDTVNPCTCVIKDYSIAVTHLFMLRVGAI